MSSKILKLVTDLVTKTTSFEEFIKNFAKTVSGFTSKEKGDAFEWFAKLYFISHPKRFDVKRYFARLDSDIPLDFGVSLKDVGSDGIIEHPSGEISLVQVKYRSIGRLKRESVVNMAAESKLHPNARVRDLIV